MKLLKKRRYISWLSFLITLIFVSSFFQSCETKEFETDMKPSSSEQEDSSLAVKNTTTSSIRVTTTTLADQMQVPDRVGSIVPNCQDELAMNSDINACIYEKNPVAQKGAPLNLSTELKTILEELSSLQNYAVYISDTTDGLLKNEHFDVQVESDEDKERVQLSDPKGEWTTPYTDHDLSTDQAMIYHWAMYQRDWMQLNTGKWYATNKNITILNERLSDSKACAYWSASENKIKLCGGRIALSADVLAHEAGHANFSYSAVERSNSGICEKNVRCSDKKSLCDLSGEEQNDSVRCCVDKKGCVFAINEGQADFHVAILFPDKPQIGEFMVNNVRGITACSSDEKFSRNPTKNKTLTADAVYDGCQEVFGGNGEIHLMGVLYSSIWWEVYSHAEVSKKDIAKLFTEHLPLITYGDNFETIGVKIIQLTAQMFASEKSSKYSDIIKKEFKRRGLDLSP